MDKVIATTILKNKSRRDETCYFVAFTLSCDSFVNNYSALGCSTGVASTVFGALAASIASRLIAP